MALERGADAEVEEIELDQRRRVAEELDVALHERAHDAQRDPLQPGADMPMMTLRTMQNTDS